MTPNFAPVAYPPIDAAAPAPPPPADPPQVRGKRRPPEDIAVAELAAMYLAEQRQRVASGMLTQGAMHWKAWALDAYCKLFGANDVSLCRKSDLSAVLQANPRWKSPHSQLTIVRSIIGLWTWAVDNDVISRQPFKCPRGLIATPRPREAMTPEEYAAIMRTARECRGLRVNGTRERQGRAAFRLVLWFLWETGCRTCEAKAAKWEQVDWKAGIIRLPTHKTGKVTGDDRLIPLSRRVLRLLRWIRQRRPDTAKAQGHIFLNSRGRKWEKSMINARFRQYKKLAGISRKITPYCARHGFAVRGLEAGVGERQLAHAMGHTTTRYIEWYGRTARNNLAYLTATAEKLSEASKSKRHEVEAQMAQKTHVAKPGSAVERKRPVRLDATAIVQACTEQLQAGACHNDICRLVGARFGMAPRSIERHLRKAKDRLLDSW